MSKKGLEKDMKIESLKKEISELKGQLFLSSYLHEKYRKGEIDRLWKRLQDPVLPLPNGDVIQFSSLNKEQLEYLESLTEKQKRL